MTRTEKEQFIADLKERFNKADAALSVSFTKLDVSKITALRKQFRDAGVDYRVVKNTLAKRAAEGTVAAEISETFVGPTALIFGYEDVVAPAKVLHGFLKEKENEGKIEVKAGVVQGKKIGVQDVEALAKMPGLEELRATIACLLNTPATQLARILNTPAQQMAQVLKAKSEQEEAAS